MSTPSTNHNINPVRTFKEDASRASAITQNSEFATEIIMPEKSTSFPQPPVATEELKADNDISVHIPAKPKNLASEINQYLPEQKETVAPELPEQVFEKTLPLETAATAYTPVQKLPEYLELNEEVNAIRNPEKESLLSDTDDVYDEHHESSGTIIRDTKRKRFRLIPAMIQAVLSWFGETKSAYDQVHHPIHTVAKAEVRKEVIQKAVTQGEQAPKEDFEEVSKHLKGVKRAPISATLSFKEKSEIPAPSWSYVEEKQTTAPKEAEVTAVIPLKSTSENDEVIPPAPVVQAPLESTPQQVATAVSYIPKKEVPLSIPQAPKKTVETVSQPPKPLTVQAVAEKVTEIIPKEEPVIIEKKIKETQVLRTDISKPRYAQEKVTVPFPVVTLILVVLGAIALGVGISYYIFVLKDAPQEKAVVYTVPSLVETQTNVPVELTGDRIAFLSQLLREVQSHTSVTQIYPTINDANGGALPAPVQTTLEHLELQTSGSFNRNVQEITFGGVNGVQPFIVVKTANFDIAFAGMLQWEQTLSADLAPLFGQPVTETFDPQARTNTQVRSAFYKDTIASNKNVRILLDGEGKDRVVYTFVNQNTILITTDRQALETLLPLIQ